MENRLPVVITRELIIYPSVVSPVIIGRPFSLKAAREALTLNKQAIFVAQLNPEQEIPSSISDILEYGTIGLFLQHLAPPDGTIRAVVEGLKKVKIVDLVYQDDTFYAYYEEIEPVVPESPDIEKYLRLLREYFAKYIEYVKTVPETAFNVFDESQDPWSIAYRVLTALRLKFSEQIELFKINNLEELLKKLVEILIREIEFINLKINIETRVSEEIKKYQKQFFLQQEMKEIQKELGVTEEDEYENLEKTIQQSKMPEEVKKKALGEVAKLRRMPTNSPDAAVIRNYLDWLINLPWGIYTEDNLDISNARKILDEDHYGLEEQKERILEYLAVLKLKGEIRGQVICFVGPPGVGKTSLAKSIARALNRKFVRISLGGLRDEAEIKGHRRTYVGAMPGKIIQQIRRAGSSNPVFLLDEIDKVGQDWRGDPQAALMEVLDPEVNKSFQDHYLEVEFDLSQVLFITTANTTYTIPKPLLDRMEVIPIRGYLENEKYHIAKKFLIPKQIKSAGLPEDTLKITRPAIYRIINEYSREAGLRELERQIAKITRKAAKNYADKAKKTTVTAKNLEKFLGPPRYRLRELNETLPEGVAYGLAWTEYGGDILRIEVAKMEGSGKLELTGQLGDVMKESAKAALTYIRANYQEFELERDFYNKLDLHLHVPEGAIPKDGPSAGVTILTAMVSSLTGKKVPSNIAMTGEITITGQVLAVGGLEEKLLAAKRYGIATVYLPLENKRDVEEMKKDITEKLEIRYISHVSELIKDVFNF
uniref:Lon protease n=1 Tax=candidate division WOR-3 bacterium TaxID=2052148 RepID=A0A7V3ZY96_UNCW3